MLRRTLSRLNAPAKLVTLEYQTNFTVRTPRCIAIMTLNSPTTRNSMTEAMGTEFTETIETINKNAEVSAVILTGAGSAFSAGGDVAFLHQRVKNADSVEGRKNNIDAMLKFYDRFLCVRRLKVPVVAALNGPAIGAGFCVALACDFRVATVEANVAVNFTRVGIHPGMGATYHLPRLVGYNRATQLLLTGETISATVAKEYGLLYDCVSKDRLLSTAVSLATSFVTSNSKIAVEETVKTLRGCDDELRVALRREAEAQAECYAQGNDLMEALAAIRERRSPMF